ncbi:hypothetical protein H0H87_009042 [Tephrocybe sp. NHM501043]|nr:hypothetical protein H0H87_009042 [Tephrocybe sp. NHM501043]
MRDSDRINDSSTNIQDRACLNVWRELLIDYCVLVVDQSLDEKRSVVEDETQDKATKRKVQGHIFAEQVKRSQVHNELKVESIIRRRAIDDSEARETWDAAAK